MSEYGVIADVSETLLKLLQERMRDLVASDHITLASPAEVELDTSAWLTLFLYQVVENHHLKNLEMERIDSNRLRYPPFVVDLFYLVVAYAQKREDEHRILGRVMQVFASQPALRGSRLQGTLEGSEEELRVLFHPLPLEELLRLWNAFNNKPYKLSISYQVTSVKIDSLLPPLAVQPAVERTRRLYGE